MNDLTTREPANDPQDLERLLVARENAGDVTGMTALFERDVLSELIGFHGFHDKVKGLATSISFNRAPSSAI
jgi:hypothetical protein